MIKIKTPATTSNLSVGFDTVGIALNIYNVFSFKEHKKNVVKGFKSSFSVNSNLVLKAYIAFALKYLEEKEIKNVEITLEENNIPVSRGLGSSASCILSGILAANEINKLHKSLDECVNFACELEGHSDNVFACAYGFLNASCKSGDKYIHKVYEISNSLNFYLMIPPQEGQTKELRNILPKKIDFTDAIYNLSRIIFLPDAFKKGDFKLLKNILKDELHEKYRYPYIPLYNEIKQLSTREDIIVSISGSGTSVLLISDLETIEIPEILRNVFKLIKVDISEGTKIEVIE